MREITSCEVCGNAHLKSVINLGNHPLPDDLVKIGDSRVPEEYPVEVLFCDNCKTAHQRFQVPKEKLFPGSYHYRARQTQDVLDGMAQLVDSLSQKRNLAGLKVLDIGCNDGSLLTEFAKRGAETYGIEPTDAAEDARALHTIHKGFFTRETAHKFVELFGYPEIITFTNVFAHIEDLPGLLEALTVLRTVSTWIVIENHYLGAVLDRNQFDTFYHEHPRTYSLTSFENIAMQLGMAIKEVEFPVRYGGNIRVILATNRDSAKLVTDRPINENNFGDRLVALDSGVKRWRDRKALAIGNLFVDNGPIPCAAFPGRAAILMRLLGLPGVVFDKVYEKPGSRKIGYYVPGTRIPIASDADFAMNPVRPVINMAWHIPIEIERNWRLKGFKGPLIPIVDQSDFN